MQSGIRVVGWRVFNGRLAVVCRRRWCLIIVVVCFNFVPLVRPTKQEEDGHTDGAHNGQHQVGGEPRPPINGVLGEVEEDEQIAPQETALEEGPEEAAVP